jgi:hypothetical protein
MCRPAKDRSRKTNQPGGVYKAVCSFKDQRSSGLAREQVFIDTSVFPVSSVVSNAAYPRRIPEARTCCSSARNRWARARTSEPVHS